MTTTTSSNAFEALAGGHADLERELEESFTSTLRIAENESGREPPSSTKGGKKLKNALIWIDLEMTGLDVNRDSILQIAVVVTDGTLQQMVKGPELTIHHSDEVLAGMNEWCIEHHGKSGLTEKVRKSTVDMASAEAQVMEFIERYAEEGTQIAGNSVHVDVQFLKRRMPRITNYCHYRIVDVSSVGELCRRYVFDCHSVYHLHASSHASSCSLLRLHGQVVPEGGRSEAEKGAGAHCHERYPGKYRAAQVLSSCDFQKAWGMQMIRSEFV